MNNKNLYFDKSSSYSEVEVKNLLKKYGIPAPEYSIIKAEDDIESISLKFPVALKVCSPKIIHKTEVGGVKLKINNKSELVNEFKQMKKKFPKENFLVETMKEKGLELIVGLINDKTFGLCIVFGLGGIFTEIFEDVSFRAIPITRYDAEDMINDIRAKKILEGFRGINIKKGLIIDLLIKINKLALDFKDQIDQLDLNPVLIRENDLYVLDAKMITRSHKKFTRNREKDENFNFDTMKKFLYPRNVALIGASATSNKVGNLILTNLLNGGFKGNIYPINPREQEILGIPAYKSVLEIDGNIDLAIITIPAKFVPKVVEECGKKRVKGILLITGGFSEIGKEGEELEQEVLKKARKYNIRIIGPNCSGMVNTNINLAAGFGIKTLVPLFSKGNIGLIQQSGSVGSYFVQNAIKEKVDFSLWINTGNKMDLNESDFIRYMNSDPNISTIVAYLEGVKNGKYLLKTISNIKKPLVIMKSGRTQSGQKAARSHSAALAENDKIWNGILRQNNIIRAETIEDLYDLAKGFNYIKKPLEGKRILIIESSGGLGTIASDHVDRAGLELPELDDEIKKRLREILPSHISPNNPLDMAVIHSEPFERVASIGIMDKYDGLLLIFGDPVLNASRIVSDFKKNTDKPIVVVFSGGGEVEEMERKKIYDLKVPIYPTVTRAIRYFHVCTKIKKI